MLYIIATPIGHLDDFTLRSIETLKKVDTILCEDTRVTLGLLHHYGIQKPLVSYHSFNEKKRVEEILEKLKMGHDIALVSDAGTPLFQDPGALLIEACVAAHIPFTSLPGPSSILSALILSGFRIEKFQFVGFLSKKSGEIKETLQEALSYPGLTVAFESPQRLLETLKILQELKSDASICVIREITKKFETAHRGSLFELIEHFSKEAPRGEIVLVLEGVKESSEKDFTPLAEAMIHEGLSKKTAIQLASKWGFVDKDTLYKKGST